MTRFSHFDEKGRAVMVDVSGKAPTLRTAVASALVRMSSETLSLVLDGQTAKGDVFAVARLAGIAAAKKTPDLIPLAHPLSIHAVSIDFTADRENGTIRIESKVRAHERTGVEMEAMVAASIAALAVYDMCKGIDKGITIGDIALLFKEGGKSGVFRREGGP
jgi:cyclic pyranopterin phosphate synthase